MRKFELILYTTVIFVCLFYDETVGYNLGIFGAVIAFLTYLLAPQRHRTKTLAIYLLTSLLSAGAFAWYGDTVSFFALLVSLFLLRLKAQNKNFRELIVIPVAFLSGVTFPYRIFLFSEWLPRVNSKKNTKQIIAFVVFPLFFLTLFFAVYTMASDTFSSVFTSYTWDINVFLFIAITCIGFFLSFNYWNFARYRNTLWMNTHLRDDFNRIPEVRSTYSFLDTDTERTGGLISFIAVSVLLVVFLGVFNYEQFVQDAKTASQLSAETHQRVYAVILSIVLAVFMVMFYFKGAFNFDPKAKKLQQAAIGWLVLNALLVLSAMAKNTEYIFNFGVTYKRLGVYAFMLLCLVGLYLTFLKIKHKKTNAYLFNRMAIYFYATLLLCSIVNWGGLATKYNISTGKSSLGDMQQLRYNHQLLKEKYQLSPADFYIDEMYGETSFLSRIGYYAHLRQQWEL